MLFQQHWTSIAREFQFGILGSTFGAVLYISIARHLQFFIHHVCSPKGTGFGAEASSLGELAGDDPFQPQPAIRSNRRSQGHKVKRTNGRQTGLLWDFVGKSFSPSSCGVALFLFLFQLCCILPSRCAIPVLQHRGFEYSSPLVPVLEQILSCARLLAASCSC